ncbi:MAG: peptide deformylase [Pseudomonadales bacterium]|nr:peptide deformylase [Pseudomonadales bacterium]
MTARTILRMGDPRLREPARALTEAERTAPELSTLIDDLVDTLDAAGGVGLAAPQIGVPLRVAVIRLNGGPSRYGELPVLPLTVYLNPEITVVDPATQGFWEGCLSVPGLRGWVERPRAVRVAWTDLDGARQERLLEGFLATVFQHEFDHLDGRLYVDRITDTRRLVFEDQLDAWLAAHGDPTPAA